MCVRRLVGMVEEEAVVVQGHQLGQVDLVGLEVLGVRLLRRDQRVQRDLVDLGYLMDLVDLEELGVVVVGVVVGVGVVVVEVVNNMTLHKMAHNN
jgi:hypothetical protein